MYYIFWSDVFESFKLIKLDIFKFIRPQYNMYPTGLLNLEQKYVHLCLTIIYVYI